MSTRRLTAYLVRVRVRVRRSLRVRVRVRARVRIRYRFLRNVSSGNRNQERQIPGKGLAR